MLYNYALEEEAQELRVQASMHGAKIKDDDFEGLAPSPEEDRGLPKFRDPSEYDNLSDAERKELTNKMLQRHKAWAGDSPLGGKKVIVENHDG